jgi:hypothetical protein
MKMVFMSCINVMHWRVSLKFFLIPNEKTHQWQSVFPPGGFPVFSPSRIAFLASSLEVWMGNTLTLYAVYIGILSLKIKWSYREENSSFFCVLRFTVIENLHPIHLLAFISWCSNLIIGITLLLCFVVISKYFNSQLINWRTLVLS